MDKRLKGGKMKKALFCLALALIIISLTAGSKQWNEFQRDLGIQAGAYKDSPEHLALRQRETRSYEVGDTETFWKWDLSVMPPLWVQTPATCRAVGAHCYIFVADSEWGVHMVQADVDEALFRLEESTVNDTTRGAIEMDIDLFGPIPDELDNDPRLIVFYSALGSFQGNYFDGYFSPYNQVTEAQAQQMNPPGHSNECEMIYMTCHPLDPIAPVRLSVLSHELQHLIHWGQDTNEETWLNEGCSELAMVVYGVPDPITGFPSNPDNSLTAWNQSFADYVKVMLFFTYLQEHYDAAGLIQDLVSDPANGISSLTQQLAVHYPDVDFGELFTNWNIANILDTDTPGNGLYNYTQLDLPQFATTNLNANPYPSNQAIQPYAADYLAYTFDSEPFQRVVSSAIVSLRLTALFFDPLGFCTELIDLGTGHVIELPHNLGNHHRAVFVLSNPSSSLAYYDIYDHVDSDDPINPALPEPMISCYPNPFRAGSGSLRIDVRSWEQIPGCVQIYNSRGQLVRRLETTEYKGSAPVSLDWDGRDGCGNAVSGGIYLLRFGSGTKSAFQKLCLIR